jgi:hypothetical protein
MLGLDYYSLKGRLEAHGSPPTPSRTAEPPGFIELPTSTLATPGECVMELESTRGAKMRVHLKGVGFPDLAALTRSFWDVA